MLYPSTSVLSSCNADNQHSFGDSKNLSLAPYAELPKVLMEAYLLYQYGEQLGHVSNMYDKYLMLIGKLLNLKKIMLHLFHSFCILFLFA